MVGECLCNIYPIAGQTGGAVVGTDAAHLKFVDCEFDDNEAEVCLHAAVHDELHSC